jgi:hypothetical protein
MMENFTSGTDKEIIARFGEARQRGYLLTHLRQDHEIGRQWEKWCERSESPCLRFHEYKQGYGTVSIAFFKDTFLSPTQADVVGRLAFEAGIIQTTGQARELEIFKKALQRWGWGYNHVHREVRCLKKPALVFLDSIVPVLRAWGWLSDLNQLPFLPKSLDFLPGEFAWVSYQYPIESAEGLVTVLETRPGPEYLVRWCLSQHEMILPASMLHKLTADQQAHWLSVAKKHRTS